jgi:hypothetical protein
MTTIKPSDHGIVVEHKDNGMHYAVSDKNYNPEIHRKVRDLKPGESVRTYLPRRKESLEALASPQGTSEPAGDQEVGSGDASSAPSPKTEGSAPAASQEKKGN